jgi:hypothetical protein
VQGFVIHAALSGSTDLAAQLPATAYLLNPLPVTGSTEVFWCARLEEPLRYRLPSGFDTDRAQAGYLDYDTDGPLLWVQVIAIRGRGTGAEWRPGMRSEAVDLAYVVDLTLGRDPVLDPAKIDLIGVIEIDGLDTGQSSAPPPGAEETTSVPVGDAPTGQRSALRGDAAELPAEVPGVAAESAGQTTGADAAPSEPAAPPVAEPSPSRNTLPPPPSASTGRTAAGSDEPPESAGNERFSGYTGPAVTVHSSVTELVLEPAPREPAGSAPAVADPAPMAPPVAPAPAMRSAQVAGPTRRPEPRPGGGAGVSSPTVAAPAGRPSAATATSPEAFRRRLEADVAAMAKATGLHGPTGTLMPDVLEPDDRPRPGWPYYRLHGSEYVCYTPDPAEGWRLRTTTNLDELHYWLVNAVACFLADMRGQTTPQRKGMPWRQAVTRVVFPLWIHLVTAVNPGWAHRIRRDIARISAAWGLSDD